MWIRHFKGDHATFDAIPFKHAVGAVMAENPPTPAPQAFIPIDGLTEAPIIYFDLCPTFGNNGGLINVMLATSLVEPIADGGVRTKVVAVAHLRMTAMTALNLRDTIGNALLIGAPVRNPEGKAN
jgi:hypothetical protein